MECLKMVLDRFSSCFEPPYACIQGEAQEYNKQWPNHALL